jgi:enoyl-CoA hydratase/carnithine racemase
MKQAPEEAKEFVGKALRLEWPRKRVALATFTRAKELNTLSLELLSELRRALAIATRHRAAALILTGEGRAFCAGASLKLFLDEHAPIGRTPAEWRDRYLAPTAALFDSFEQAPFPVIAAINGYALGGGGEMALSSDFRIMSRTAKFGLPETKIGATPAAGGVQKLIRHVGRTKALEWIILSTHIDAAAMEKAGLLFAVTEPDQLVATALDLAEQISRLSPAAIAQAKRSIYVSEDADLQTAQRFGLEALCSLMSTSEWREGVTSFLEKRPPRFVDDSDT